MRNAGCVQPIEGVEQRVALDESAHDAARGGPRDVGYEITEHVAPSRSAFRGLNGPIRADGTVTVEPLEGGTRSKFTLEFDLKGRGVGVMLAPLARANARKEIPKSHARFKEILERAAD